MKRTAYSIPLNIVEGCGMNSEKDFVHFLDMALGSAHELEYYTLLVYDLNFLDINKFTILNEKANEVKAKLIKLIKSIRDTAEHLKTPLAERLAFSVWPSAFCVQLKQRL